MKKMIAFALVFTLLGPMLWAGPGSSQEHTDKIKKNVASCLKESRRVTIETYDDRLLSGVVTEAQADTFIVGHAGGSATLKYSDVKSIKWRSPISKHVKALVGAAVITAAIFGLVYLLGGLGG